MLSAPADSMIMQPGTLQLTDCLNLCRQNASCLAINFETGLCVLLQESADKNPQALQKSQFPVFTIYAHKICLQGKCLMSLICSSAFRVYIFSLPSFHRGRGAARRGETRRDETVSARPLKRVKD